jgi:nitrogen fixation/metabolism regulation signal transduction histidine kinase
MGSSRVRKLLFRTLPALALLIGLLLALLMVGGVQDDPAGPGGGFLYDSYVWVLVITVVALAILLWSIADRVINLVKRVRAGVPGAKLAARWVINFLMMSLPPAMIVFIFSAWFLTSTIDSWFDVRVESALEDSLQLGQDFLGARTLEVRNQVREAADELDRLSEDGEALRRALLDRVRASGPSELSVLEQDGTLVATANINALNGLADRPKDFTIVQVVEQGEYAAVEPTGGDELQIRVLQRMPPPYPGASTRILQAIYPLPPDITALTGSIEQEYRRYQNVSYLRTSLKQSFLLILSLVLFLTVLLAILAALNTARRMVSPLSKLSTATRAVAAGDFGQEVEGGTRDEIGFLVSSFNEMTQALKSASQEAEESRAELQAQREYLETVLGNLSSGVLTIDQHGLILTANAACRAILGLDAGHIDKAPPLESLATLAPYLGPFVAAIAHQAGRGRASWQQEIKLERPDKPLVLLMRGTRLPLPSNGSDAFSEGHVVVFDDVTILNQAQREAAWAEVARRLAHEVRNPLTPIRLAAERLRMKLAGKLPSAEEAVLDRASSTIVAQVEALRRLVDAFGDYASEPELNRSEIALDALIREVASLYREGHAGLQIDLDLVAGPDGLMADADRLRQLLHNVIRNADEAMTGEGAVIGIRSRTETRDGSHQLVLEICDNGPGFPAPLLENPFEPYVSDKPGGSGLGLAICRKIVSEHEGEITLSNPPGGGACVRIVIPFSPG